VGVLHILTVLVAVTVIALLPCMALFIVYADNVIDAAFRAIRRARARRRRGNMPEPLGPPLQQIADDLHRLGLARLSCVEGSVRHIAVTKAYDRRLGHACRALDIEEHIADLEALDLELERLRVEGALLESGFVLASVNTRQNIDGRTER
jgi:hypothetical protein